MTGPTAPGTLSARTARRCDELLSELSDEKATQRVRDLRSGLDGPLRVAIAGPSQGGKSTLVNALLRQVADDPGVTRIASVQSYLAGGGVELFDTPPLGGPFEAFAREAVTGAEALVFVQTGGSLDALRQLVAQSGSSAATCVAVLGRADEIDGPRSALDPLAPAKAVAAEQEQQLAGIVEGVVPVCGLWAATARTGALNADDVAALGNVARASDPQQKRLLALLGPVGVTVGAALFTAGCTTQATVNAELSRLSGIDALSAEMDRLRGRTDVLKSQWAITQLERTPGHDASARAVRDAAEELRLDPAMQRLNDVKALQMLASGVGLPTALAGEVVRMATSADPVSRLGAPAGSTSEQLQELATAAAARWHAFGGDAPRTTPDQELLARLMYRACSHLRMQLSGTFL